MNDQGGAPVLVENETGEPALPLKELLEDWTTKFSYLAILCKNTDGNEMAISNWFDSDDAKHLHIKLFTDYLRDRNINFAAFSTPERNLITQVEATFQPIYDMVLDKQFSAQLFKMSWNKILDLVYGEGTMEGKYL